MKKRSNFKLCIKLTEMVRPLMGFMLLAVVLGTLGHLAAAFIPILGATAFVNLLGYLTYPSITAIFIAVIIFAILRGFLRYGEQYCNHYIAFKLLAIIRDKLFAALRKLCPAKLEGRDKGNLIAIITADIELLEVFFAHTLSPIAIGIIFSIIMCIVLSLVHPLLGLVGAAAYITVGLVIPILSSKSNKKMGENLRKKSGDMSSFILESLRGLSEIIQYGIGRERLKAIQEKTENMADLEKEMKLIRGKSTATTHSIIWLYNVILIILASILCIRGDINFGGALIAIVCLMSSFGPVISLSDLGAGLQNTFAAANRVLDILEETPVTQDITGKADCVFNGAKADSLSFSYGGDEILKDISLEIAENSIVGIVGKSGSGKSTFLKLLMRFWQADKNSLKISNRAIDEINTTNLRDIESYVTQETHLFHDSIKNNLKIAKLDATEDELVVACKKASIHEFITSLAKGYDTEVGELGDSLSGGERQRLGLARAFLHGAPLMLLDEPTSNLDSLNEAIILKSINDERENKTVVLVSHRLSTMKLADRVFSVENGRMS